jgi:gliding motility-associated-like protein
MVMKNSLLKLSLLLLSSFIYSNTFAMPGGGANCTPTANNVACPGSVDYCTDTPNSNGTGGSDVCATASVITFGSSCAATITGTTVNSTGNTIYGACHADAVNIVWFTFVAQGGTNEYTVTPGTLTNAMIVIDSDPCADTAFETCAATTGNNTVTTTWGFSVGDQVWVGVASAGGNDGTFTLTVESYDAPATSGNTCAQAILLCDKDPFTVDNTNCYTASGTRPSCFGSNPQQDVWFYFTVTQSGTIEWTGDPLVNSEFDWALWNISSSCPGTQLACNYNFAGNCGTNFGMGMGTPTAEYSAAYNATAGQVLAIQIDNFARNGHGFNFTWGGTALIGPVAQFSATPTLQCAASMNVSFTNSSIGTPQNWDFGNGNTYTGSTPPAQVYNTPGTYATTVTINSGGCTATATQFVQLFAPVSATENHTDEVCLNACDGTISLSPTGGNGIYQYTWTPNVSSGPTATGLCAGNYQISIVDGVCGTPFIVNVTIDPGIAPSITGDLSICVNEDTQLSGGGTPAAVNPWTSSNTTVATVNSTGLVTGLSAGSTTITYTDNNGCSNTADVTVTALDNAGFSYSSGTFCVTGSDPTPTITGLPGGTFSAPGVTINASTGEIDLDATGVGGPFTVTYTTNGTCPNSSTFQISVVDSPSAEFTYNSPFCQADPQLTESPAFVGAASGGVFSSTPGGLSLNTSNGVVTFATSDPGIYDVTNTIAASGGCAAAEHIEQIEILLTPTVNDPADQELCAGLGTTLVTFSGNSGSTTYNWTNDNTSIGLAASGNTNIASFTAINTGTTNQVATITVTPTLNGCDGTPQTFTITVKPIPTVNDPSNQELCADETTTAVIFSGNIGGATYNWTNDNTSIGLAASGSGDIASFTAINTGSTPVTATITVTPSFNGCDGNPQVFTITVNPLPTLDNIADQDICAGENTTTVTFTGNSGSTTYSWTNDNTAIGLGANGTGNIASFTTTNAGATPIQGFINVTTSLNGCAGESKSFRITVYPLPVLGGDTEVCVGLTANVTPNSGGTWSSSNTGVATVTDAGLVTGVASGTVTLTYTDTFSGCENTMSFDVNPLPVLGGATTVCVNSTANVTPNSGGTWSSSNTGIATVTNGGVVTGVSAGPVTLTFTDGTTGCVNTRDITVNPLDNAGFNYSTGTFCVTGSDPSPTITGLTGGTFSAPGVSINASTGVIDVSATGVGGPFTVTYTTNGTCPNSSTFQISVVDSPSAEFTYNSPFCQADPQLTESPAFVGAASGGVFSSTPGGLSLNTSNGVVTFATSDPGIYDVTNTIAASGGCAAAEHTEQIEILLTPTVNDPADQELCAVVGTTEVVFSGNSGSTTYNWTNDNTSIGLGANGIGNIPSFTATNAGTTDEVAIIEVTPTLNGCDGTPQIFTITVKPIPTVNAISNQEFCLGEATTDIVFGGNIGTTDYNWTSSGDNIGIAPSGDTEILSFTPTASGTATITVIPTADGCDGNSEVFTITVNPIPVISGSLSICLDAGTTQLSSTTTGTNWSSSNTSVATVDNNGLVTLLTEGSTDITFEDDNGCSSTETINVTNLDDASFDFTNYCVGSANGPTNIVTANGTFSFNPAPGDGATINPTTGVITGGVAGTTYSVVYTTTGNCSATTFPAVPVTVLALPTATITGGSNICAGDPLPELSISFTGTADWTYTLNGVQATTSNNPEVITPTTGGTYTVTTVTDANCTNTSNSSSTVINITTPVASFIATPESGETPLEVVFTNTGSGDTFSWDFETDGTIDATTENTTNTYVDLGVYTVTLTITENGCPASATIEITVVGGSFVELPNGFSPDGQGLNELFKARSENLVSENLQIFNRWGQLLYEGPAWDGKYKGEPVPEGTYYFIFTGVGADGKVYEGKEYTGSLTLVRAK